MVFGAVAPAGGAVGGAGFFVRGAFYDGGCLGGLCAVAVGAARGSGRPVYAGGGGVLGAPAAAPGLSAGTGGAGGGGQGAGCFKHCVAKHVAALMGGGRCLFFDDLNVLLVLVRWIFSAILFAVNGVFRPKSLAPVPPGRRVGRGAACGRSRAGVGCAVGARGPGAGQIRLG